MSMRIAWNKGKKMSKEMRQKMLGNKNGHGNKGRKMSPEWIEKLRVAKLGKPGNAKGSKRSPKQIETIKRARRNYLLSIDPNYRYVLDTSTRKGNKRVRRERLKQYGGSHTQQEWQLMKEKYNFTCPSCFKKEPEIKLTRDHIVPLSSQGTDDIGNIQPLCNPCNATKYTRLIRY